jgi:hypothetical protein
MAVRTWLEITEQGGVFEFSYELLRGGSDLARLAGVNNKVNVFVTLSTMEHATAKRDVVAVLDGFTLNVTGELHALC